MPSSARLTQGSIARHLVVQTAPMILGIACIMGVGLVDAWLIGLLGADPLAAVSFIFPVSVALSSLGVGVMVGVNSVVARALGAGHDDRASARAVHGILFALMVGCLIAATLLLFHVELFRLLQAPDNLLPLINAYMVPYAMSLPALLLAMACNGVLRAQGEAVKSSSILIIVATVNAALDPLLIFGLGPLPALGIKGAALASALAHLTALLVGLRLVSTCALPLNPGQALRQDLTQGMLDIGRVGAPAAVSNAINPVGLAVLTAILAGHGQALVAAFGAAGRLQSFAVVPLLALSSSIGAITAQNWGAEQPDRARRALNLSSAFCLSYGLLVALCLVLFRDSLGGLFSDDPDIAGHMARYLTIASWGFSGYGLLVVTNGALNAIGQARTAFLLSVARVLLLMVPLAWFGSRLLGPSMVFGAELAANLIGGIAAYLVAHRLLCGQRIPLLTSSS